MNQISIFDGSAKLKITKPIRLIELFAGYGSQALALKYLDVPFEHWRTCEWAIKSIQAYKDMHFHDVSYDCTLSKEELVQFFLQNNISADYSNPLDERQLRRMPEKALQTIYSNAKVCRNLLSVVTAKAEDFGIIDTDKYTYIMSYSFPCKDLSLAGLQKGMRRDSGTRSGMLWQVERILSECKELPQILIMENVPEVIGSKNFSAFTEWMCSLRKMGYNSAYKVLNAVDYKIPQNRRRCFMVSWLGDYFYDFPIPFTLPIKMKDLLESNVAEKYYLNEKAQKYIEKRDGKYTQISDGDGIAKSAITAKGTQNWTGNFYSQSVNVERERERLARQSVQEEEEVKTVTNGILLSKEEYRKTDVSCTIVCHYAKGLTKMKNHEDPAVIEYDL